MSPLPFADPATLARFRSFTQACLRDGRVGPPPNPSTSVELARDPEELRQARRLRYQVFTVEGGDPRYADHARGEHRDAHDDPESGARVLVARGEQGQLLGTVRLCVWGPTPFINPDAYPLDRLARRWDLPAGPPSAHCCLLDRGAVAAPSRGRGVSTSLWLAHLRLARALGFSLALAFASPKNAASMKVARGVGFVPESSEQRRGPRLTLLVRDLRCP